MVPLLLAGAMMHAPSIIAMLILSQSPYSAPGNENILKYIFLEILGQVKNALCTQQDNPKRRKIL
jgi:hypothetical protein